MFTIPVINIETNYQIIIAEQIATYIYSDHIQLQAGKYFCDPHMMISHIKDKVKAKYSARQSN